MPSYLRHCFAFFSLYPKDYGCTGAEVVNLWVSLGLLRPEVGSQKIENTARQYIDELHSRSFLEDFEDFGHLYYFKVHDLVHDLAQYVAKEEILVVNSVKENGTVPSVDCQKWKGPPEICETPQEKKGNVEKKKGNDINLETDLVSVHVPKSPPTILEKLLTSRIF
ncbi:hypothetical protein VNO80_03594 [Phaseolus coccineus]|uniref:Disease resistance protein winged helix domain-containing protein n=1 Tax=Phaseolus coccineus TaxID=3886 RepID=A0AAN9NWD2_PHACN